LIATPASCCGGVRTQPLRPYHHRQTGWALWWSIARCNTKLARSLPCKAAQKLQMWAGHAGDSTSVKPSLVAFLCRVAMSRFRARCSYSAALRSR
jgi:hypothetical protein